MGNATAATTASCSQLIAERRQFGHLITQSRKTIPQSWQYQIIFDIGLIPGSICVLDQAKKLLRLDSLTTLQIDGCMIDQPEMRSASVFPCQSF